MRQRAYREANREAIAKYQAAYHAARRLNLAKNKRHQRGKGSRQRAKRNR